MDTALPSRSSNRSAKPVEKTLGGFVSEQLEARLRKVAFELRNVRQTMEQERVHQLRVALRRLIESVRVAKGVLPEEGTAQVLEDLGKIMKDAGRVRSCDIAADLLLDAGAPADAPTLRELAQMRRKAEHKLYDHAQQAFRRHATLRWREALQLGQSAELEAEG